MAKKHYRKADFDVRLFLEELESRLAPAAAPAWQPLGPRAGALQAIAGKRLALAMFAWIGTNSP